MNLELELYETDTLKIGLQELGDMAFTMAQNLRARRETPILGDGTDIWQTLLDSKTFLFYAGLNKDNRVRFKIDNEPDLATILSQPVRLDFLDESIQINEEIYNKSSGREFVVISKQDLKEANADYYAIRADKYQIIRKRLNEGKLTANGLVKAGAFIVKDDVTPKEAKSSDGWLELQVGKNRASKSDYEKALKEFGLYVDEAQKKGCFRHGYGMKFDIRTKEKKYAAYPCVIENYLHASETDVRLDFDSLETKGYLLRVKNILEIAVGGARKTATLKVV